VNRIDPSRRELLIATGLCVLFGGRATAGPSFSRRLKLKNANTGETFEGPYRDRIGPIPEAIADLAHFLRDHHVNKVGPLDVGTIDFLADVMDAVGVTNASVLSGYRTPETNAKLRATMFGVAEKSQHMYGRAIDVSFDERLADAETIARQMARGGVGWYPRSHFVHLDTGPTRSWEMGGAGLDRVLTRGAVRPFAVAERHKLQPPARAAPAASLPPCRQTAANGVEVVRGMGCAP
jgi:uncharacterized protein YcbK (DUF882 family)